MLIFKKEFKKEYFYFFILVMSIFPLLSYADITFVNNTDYYFTASTHLSPCSSVARGDGILAPHGQATIPKAILSSFCKFFSCDVNVFMSKDCSGKRVAAITMNTRKGITDIKNYDRQRVIFSGSGSNGSANPGM